MVAGARKKVRYNWFDVLNALLMLVLSASILFPFLHLLSLSFSTPAAAGRYGLHLIPGEVTLYNYEKVVTNIFIWRGYANTLLRVVVGTALALSVTSLGAYALSKRFFPHRGLYTFLITFTMFFNGGLIPTFLVVMRLGLVDKYLALVLPSMVNVFHFIIARNYFLTVPKELEESASMDGAKPFTIFARIVVPVAAPVLATLTLWIVVFYWNEWFEGLIYIRDTSKFVLQIVLRRIVLEGSDEIMNVNEVSGREMTSPEVIKAATIFFTTIPVLVVYPFLQRYFVKGIYLGSLKG
jgi:putative aldouronate transport system permease protein